MSITSFLSRTVVTTAGAMLVLVPVTCANAAGAAGKDDGNAQKFEVRKNRAGQTVYCAQVPPAIGSRIAITRCETAENWKAEGVNLHIAPAKG